MCRCYANDYVNEQSLNHISLVKGRPRCRTKSPTVKTHFHPYILGLILTTVSGLCNHLCPPVSQ